ncbi:hypothetical protein HDU86_003067 [Geranomyces michiganensis]|nr:hypothetical protein HDU86_003067 [Geranomyces michiganensis]
MLRQVVRLSPPRTALRSPKASALLSSSSSAFLRPRSKANYSTTPSNDDLSPSYPPPPPPPQQQLSFVQRFGTPISTLLLYSSLALISLQYMWTRLTFEETREKEAARIAALEEELQRAKALAAERQEQLQQQRMLLAGGTAPVASVQSNGRRWWPW